MKTITSIIILLVITYSCSLDKNKNTPVARIDNTIIYQSEIDSLVNTQMHLIYVNTINHIINNKIITLNSNNNKLKLDSSIYQNTNIISIDEKPLFSAQKIQRQNNLSESLLDSLKKNYDIKLFLPPASFDYNKLKMLSNYNIQNSKENRVIYVLFNYCCSICSLYDNILRELGKEFKVNLKYIYYSDFVSIEALACDAAKKYGKYWQMHDSIISRSCDNKLDSVIKIASSIGIDTTMFKKIVFDKNIIHKHVKNRDILEEMNIYSIPTYVYNNSIYYDIESIKLVLLAEK